MGIRLAMMQNIFKELIIDNSEVAIDCILADGLLKEIPIIKNLISLYSIKTTISDKIFYKKIISFYKSFNDVNRESFDKWQHWAIENTEQSEKIASSLVLHIDSQNELTKCKLIGHLFKKLIEEELTINKFETYMHAISTCSLQDLKKHCIDGGDSSPFNNSSLCQRMQFTGFYAFTAESLSNNTKIEYEITIHGSNFIDLLNKFDWVN